MAATATVEWDSKDVALLRTLTKVEKGFDDIARRQDRLEKGSRQATTAMVGGWDNVAVSIGRTAMALVGAGSILTAFDRIRDATRQAMEDAQKANAEFDEMFRKFRVQAGLDAVQGEAAKQRILAIGKEQAVKEPAIAEAAARGLVGAGFKVEDATGEGLRVLLRGQAAMNAAGKAPADSERLAKDMAAYLTSQGMESTPANLERALKDAFALREGAFELSDFAEMGKHGSVFAGKLSQQEQLAAFGALVDAMPSAEAGTGMRNVVSRLSTASVTLTGAKALKRLGIRPEDVDLTGENFGTALDRISGGLAGIPEKDRDDVLRQLFEEAGVAPAQILLNERQGKLQRYQKGMETSGAEYDAAAKTGQAGRGAAKARLGLEQKTAQAAEDAGDDLVEAALDAEMRARGYNVIERSMSAWQYAGLRKSFVSQEAALGLVSREAGVGTFDEGFAKSVLGRVEKAAAGEVPPGFTTTAAIQERERAAAAEAAKAEENRRRYGFNAQTGRLGSGFSNAGRSRGWMESVGDRLQGVGRWGAGIGDAFRGIGETDLGVGDFFQSAGRVGEGVGDFFQGLGRSDRPAAKPPSEDQKLLEENNRLIREQNALIRTSGGAAPKQVPLSSQGLAR